MPGRSEGVRAMRSDVRRAARVGFVVVALILGPSLAGGAEQGRPAAEPSATDKVSPYARYARAHAASAEGKPATVGVQPSHPGRAHQVGARYGSGARRARPSR